MAEKTFMRKYKLATPKVRRMMRLQRNAPNWAKLIK